MQYFLTKLLAATLVFCLCLPVIVAAQQTGDTAGEATSSQDLAAMALAAKDQFQPFPADRVPPAKTRLYQAIKQLDAFLSTSTQENTAAWKRYLQWEDLLSEVEKDEPDLARFGQVLRLLYGNYTSLEHPTFAELRSALLNYSIAYQMANNEDLASDYKDQLDLLAQQLAAYAQEPTTKRGQAIGALVGWLETARQAEDLVAAIRSRYWRPNLYTVVSQRMVNSGLSMDIDESDDVRDCILGTTMIGSARMLGGAKVQLVDCADQAHIRLLLSGNIHSDNVGFNRGVRIFSQGETLVTGSKDVYIDTLGLSSDGSQVRCSTDSTIDAISARSCLIEKIAWKRARRSQGRAERIGSQHAEERVTSRMDERAEELLARVGNDYQDRFRNPLLRRDEFPQEMQFRTIGGLLKIVWRQANVSQLAAPDTPPPVGGDNDLTVQLHESFVSNFSRAMLGGVRLTDERLVELLEKNKMEVPDAVKLSDEKPSWAITFSSVEPVNATFSADTLRFAIRGRKFELGGGKPLRDLLEMSAIYKLQKTPEGARLTRQGDVAVDYVGVKGNLSIDQITVRTVMREKFEALFAPEFETTGITLPGRWESGGMLHLEQMVAHSGWLNLAWTQTKVETK